MQTRIIPKPRKRSEILDVLKAIGVVTYEDNNRIVLCFDDCISLQKLARDYPGFGTLIGEPSKNKKGGL